jgi:hypothetical protein
VVVGARDDLRVGEWDFDALKIREQHHNVLEIVGFELLRTSSDLPRAALGAFLRMLEKAYSDSTPYHSNAHAADMCNAFYFLSVKCEVFQDNDASEKMRIGSILAALGHDVGHFGRNNLFLISSRHALAVTYNDRSVLECFHAASLVRLLDQEYGEDCDKEKVLGFLSTEESKSMRHHITSLVLASDPSKHFEDLSAFRVRLGADSFDALGDQGDQQQALCMLFKAADIGHSAKGWDLHQEWSSRVVQEFHEQGDEEKRRGLPVSPLCERDGFVLATSQVGFLQFICVPTFKEIARFEDIMYEKVTFPKKKKKHRGSLAQQLTCVGNDDRRKSRIATDFSNANSATASSRRSIMPPSSPTRASRRTPSRSGTAGQAALLQVIPDGEDDNSEQRKGSVRSRPVKDSCLAQCERNLQAWMNQTRTDQTHQTGFTASTVQLLPPTPSKQSLAESGSMAESVSLTD